MKMTLLILLIVTAFGAAACLPANSAQTTERAAVSPPLSGNDGAQAAGKNEPLEKSGEPETTAENPEPTPKKAAKPTPKADNFVCPEPALPCHHPEKQFEDWELSFRLPKRLVANKDYQSAPFYAIILKIYPEGCGELDAAPEVEEERTAIQKKFPSRKVFAENSCADLAKVTYDFEGKTDKADKSTLISDYLAVYAGVDEREAQEIFELIHADYPGAQLKKMTANYSQLEF